MQVEEMRNEREWETFLQASPKGTFYHRAIWKEVIERSFRYSPLYLTVRDESGIIVGACPGFILNSMGMSIYQSMPFSDYGGPVIAKHCIKEASSVLVAFVHSLPDIAYAKICFSDCELAQSFKSRLGRVNTGLGVFEIDLRTTPTEYIWKRVFSKNRRSKMRHLERDGYQAREARNRSDLMDFYELYCQNMRYISVSPYSYEFMENAWSLLHPQNLRIWLVGKDKPVGGIAVFKDERRTYWAYAGLHRGRDSNRHSIIPYALWKEIERAEEEGYTRVSLGGTPTDPQSPYYTQKMGLGGIFIQQEMVYLPLSPIGRILLQGRAKLSPAWNMIIRHLPKHLKRLPLNWLPALPP
jgi:hypothetical protein